MTAPVNDNFANAVTIAGNSGSYNFSTVDATNEAGEPVTSERAPDVIANTVWFKWVAPSNCPYVFSLAASPDDVDTVMAVWAGSSLVLLTEVAFDDDSAGLLSEVVFRPTSGTTYYLQIGGYAEGDTGALNLRWGLLVGDPVTNSGSADFGYTGAVQTFTVPVGVTSFDYFLDGAGEDSVQYGGGVGGTLPVAPGDVVDVYVGGAVPDDGSGGWPDGGPSGDDGSLAKGGAGSTSFKVNGVLKGIAGSAGGHAVGDPTLVVTSGMTQFVGGAGGDPDGYDGGTVPGTNWYGRGATQSAGGAGGVATGMDDVVGGNAGSSHLGGGGETALPRRTFLTQSGSGTLLPCVVDSFGQYVSGPKLDLAVVTVRRGWRAVVTYTRTGGATGNLWRQIVDPGPPIFPLHTAFGGVTWNDDGTSHDIPDLYVRLYFQQTSAGTLSFTYSVVWSRIETLPGGGGGGGYFGGGGGGSISAAERTGGGHPLTDWGGGPGGGGSSWGDGTDVLYTAGNYGDGDAQFTWEQILVPCPRLPQVHVLDG